MTYAVFAGGRRSGSDKGGKEDFEDMRLTLQETDYGNFLANEVRPTACCYCDCHILARCSLCDV